MTSFYQSLIVNTVVSYVVYVRASCLQGVQLARNLQELLFMGTQGYDAVGFNYRMPNINAALGLAQLEQLPKFLESKRDIAEAYKLFFGEFKSLDINFVVEPINSKSNYWLNSILLRTKEERDEFLRYSNENGVMTRPVWTLMNKLPMFSDAQCGDLKNAEHIEDRLVNLPSSVIK